MNTHLIISASALVAQLVSAFLAFRLLRQTGKRTVAIVLLLIASLMAIQRASSLIHFFLKGTIQGDLIYEEIALIISFLIMFAIIQITRLILLERANKDAAVSAETRYRTLFDQSPDGVLLVDAHGTIVDFNDQTCCQLGYTREEFRKLRISDINLLESLEDFKARFKQITKEGKAEFEVKQKTKNGEVRNVQVITQPVYLSGKLFHAAIWRDITDRKRAEEFLRKNEELLRQAVLVSQIGIFDHDHRSGAIYWSPEQRKIYGWGTEEVVTLQAFLACVHPADREEIANAVRRAHDPAGDGSFDVEHRIVRRDGEVRWLVTRSRTFFNGEGEAHYAVRTVGASLDITDRKQAEETLRAAVAAAQEEKNKSEAIIAAIGDGLVILDDEYRVVYQNEAIRKMIGNLVGQICYKAGEGRGTLCENCPVELTFRDGQVHSVERTRTTKTETIHMDITSSPLRDSSGRVIAVIEMVRDVTKRKEAEDVLRRSRNELEILVEKRTAELSIMNDQLRNLSVHLQNAREDERTMIAREIHDDLGQSLTALNMDLSLLRKRLPEDQTAAIEKAESMAGLIEATIQSVKRISSDLRPGILDHLGLSAAIEWQAKEFEKRTGIRCMVAFEPEEVVLDKGRTTALFRIFQETLTNAARHAKATEISVFLNAQDDNLLLQVKDNGRGITEGQISYPASLGLIGIRERVNNWGGSFAISGIPDLGTTVTVRIPMNAGRTM
jgi:PAS domain S-box-containing protein